VAGAIRHPVFARIYACLSSGAESRGIADNRARLLEGLSGRVLEVGAGNGLNFSHYPSSVAEAIPLPDAGFDAVVASLVLCSVADQLVALAELRRVLRPGGSLRYYEHVVSHGPRPARLQRLLDATVWPRIAGGCHLARDTGAAIRAAGFTVEREQRLAVKTSALEPAIPHLLGVARHSG
jgi:SAM-dependent methyltransferase